MNIPEELQQAIEKETARFSFAELAHARQRLTERYRNFSASFSMKGEAEMCAYVAARMPATFAACKQVFKDVLQRCPRAAIQSVLDLGAGPASASWAAALALPTVAKMTLVEQNAPLIAFGKKLSSHSSHSALRDAAWMHRKLDDAAAFSPHDLVVCSYLIGELPPKFLKRVVEAAWEAASQILIVVEPGTPVGFSKILQVREHLIALGGKVIAPCTHISACPLKAERWCHFAARLERSSIHARLKNGSLGYEDEKFSYIAFAKIPHISVEGRLLSSPAKHSGHISLELCTPRGKESKIISKKMGEVFKYARKLEWGGVYPPDEDENFIF